MTGSDIDFVLHADQSVAEEAQVSIHRFLCNVAATLGFEKSSPCIQTFVARGLQTGRVDSVMDRARFGELTFVAGAAQIGLEVEQAKRTLRRDNAEELLFHAFSGPTAKPKTGAIDLKRDEGGLRDISRLLWLAEIEDRLQGRHSVDPLSANLPRSMRDRIVDSLDFLLAVRDLFRSRGIRSDTIDDADIDRIACTVPWLQNKDSFYARYGKHLRSVRAAKSRLIRQVLTLLEVKGRIWPIDPVYDVGAGRFKRGTSPQELLDLTGQCSPLKYLVALKADAPDVLMQLRRRARWSIRHALAKNEKTPAEILVSLARNGSFEERDVRLMVARNRNAPFRLLTSLLRDNAEVVSKAASKSLEERLLSELSKKDKLTMLLMPNTAKPLGLPEHQRIHEKYGVDLFQVCERETQTPDAIVRHINSILRRIDLPLLFTVNQEGGRLSELNKVHTVTPGNMALGAIEDLQTAEELAYQAASVIAEELRAAGMTWNFAPVVDLAECRANRDVGTRSFGSDPERVARLGAAFVRGLQNNGVLATAKHFPTYGRADRDAHVALSRIRSSDADLEAYRAAAKAGVAAIMLGHVIVEDWDPSRPASVSPEAIRVIREALGYEGMIVTDGLTMKALASHYKAEGKDPINAALDSFRAGVDVMLHVQDLTHKRSKKQESKSNDAKIQTYTRLRGLIAETAHEFSDERIDRSFRKLVRAMIRFGVAAPLPSKASLEGVVRSSRSRRLMEKIGDHAITLVKNDRLILPLDPQSKRETILVLSIRPWMTALTDKTWFNQFSIYDGIREICPHSDVLRVNLRYNRKTKAGPDMDETVEAVVAAARQYDVIVAQTYNAHLPDISEHKKNQAELVNRLLEEFGHEKKIVVAALGDPHDILEFPQVPAYVATYSASPGSVSAVGRLLFGKSQPTGRLPVAIPGMYPCGHGLSFWDYENLRERYISRYSLPAETFDVPQDAASHAEGPVLDDHLRLMLRKLQGLILDGDSHLPDSCMDLAKHHQERLKDFVFLHDVGKLSTTRIKVDGQVMDVGKYRSLAHSTQRDSGRVRITYPGHEEHSYKMLQGKVPDELANIIRVHGINDVFRHEVGDIEALGRAYERLWKNLNGDREAVEFAFIAMYIDVAASHRQRRGDTMPHTDEEKFRLGFFKAKDVCSGLGNK